MPVGGVESSLEEPEDAEVDEEEGVASTVVAPEPSPPPIPNEDDGDADSKTEPEEVEEAPEEAERVGLFELDVKLESKLEDEALVESENDEDERVVTSDDSDWDAVELPTELSVVTVEFERVDELESKDDEEEVNEAVFGTGQQKF